jgi:hypothetical protein
MTRRVMLSVILIFGNSVIALAQGQSSSALKLDYDLNGVSFKSSAKYQRRESKEIPSNAILLVNQEAMDESVFVIVPKTKQDLIAGIESLRDALAKSLLTSESTKYQWRIVEKPYLVAVGKFDVERGQMLGFNGQSCLLLEYHLIQVQNQEIIVGYLSVTDKSKRAAWSFQHLAGGGNGRAGKECTVIVRSVTGEEEPRFHPGQPPPLAPGSPPPPALKKP